MLLAQNKIPYKITTRNTGDHGGSRAHSGTMRLNSDLLYEYRIYVHKDDYEQAVRLLNKK